VARDPDTIQREIESARDALAETLDVLGEKASPRRLADNGKQAVLAKFADPRIKYSLIAVGAILALAILRKLFR